MPKQLGSGRKKLRFGVYKAIRFGLCFKVNHNPNNNKMNSQIVIPDTVLSYSTRERLLASPSYAALANVSHLITLTPSGRWTAVILGHSGEANAAWFQSARADGNRFFWLAV